jgi:hypothetical protein
MKAIWIDTSNAKITEVEYRGLEDLQRMVGGGSIDFAGTINGDTVYVNDEGLYLFDRFFYLPECGQGLFAGPGVIVGTEIDDTNRTRPPKTTVEEVTSKIVWHDRRGALQLSKELGI